MMAATALPFIFWAFSSVLAIEEHQQVRCGSTSSLWGSMTGSLASRAVQTPLPEVGSDISVFWNIVSEDDTFDHGNIPDSVITRQMEILNKDYEPVGMSFRIANINRIRNSTYFNLPYNDVANDYAVERAMKGEFNVRNPAVLNVYTTKSPDLVSWGLIPNLTLPIDPSLDGVVLHINALASDWYPGHSLTHEIGHWSGLQHTFEGGCDDPVGDGVADTPPHKQGNKQCEKPVYSCPGGPPDPTDNFMNYLDDKCRTRFTPGQIERMREYLRVTRGIILDSPRHGHHHHRVDVNGPGRPPIPPTGPRPPTVHRRPNTWDNHRPTPWDRWPPTTHPRAGSRPRQTATWDNGRPSSRNSWPLWDPWSSSDNWWPNRWDDGPSYWHPTYNRHAWSNPWDGWDDWPTTWDSWSTPNNNRWPTSSDPWSTFRDPWRTFDDAWSNTRDPWHTPSRPWSTRYNRDPWSTGRDPWFIYNDPWSQRSQDFTWADRSPTQVNTYAHPHRHRRGGFRSAHPWRSGHSLVF